MRKPVTVREMYWVTEHDLYYIIQCSKTHIKLCVCVRAHIVKELNLFSDVALLIALEGLGLQSSS